MHVSGNCEYVIKHNPKINSSRVELCPNAIEPIDIKKFSDVERYDLLTKYEIPVNKTLFIYGGNLGKPQGLDFLLKVIEANENRDDSFIVIVGSGTEYPKIESWFQCNTPSNSKLLSSLPKNDYDNLVRACHIGLIFLDPRFTIPNFPSRILSYLENSMPVILSTDTNTDVGKIAEKEGFGLWCESGDLDRFIENMDKISRYIEPMGAKGLQFLKNNYTVSKVADIINRNENLS